MTKQPHISFCLENIRSAYNVGSIFRTADAAGIDTLFLTGTSAHPPHPRLKKTALGSTQSVSWEYHQTVSPLIQRLKEEGKTIVACELTQTSSSLFEWQLEADTCLVLGNEVDGVSDYVFEQADHHLHIPMFGEKTSLNVSVAAGIFAYELTRQRLLLNS